MNRLLLIACCAVIGTCQLVESRGQSAAPDRFLAVWADGSRSTGYDIVDWSWVDKQPRLNQQPLFDLGHRVRWLRDTTLEAPLPPPACVEFVGGDCLPGKLVGMHPGTAFPALPLPAHLLVEPAVAMDRPRSTPRPFLKIRPESVERVIWQRLPRDRIQPSTAFCRDGRAIEYRSLRWNESSVRLLTEQGAVSLALDELAELHLPRLDAWETLFEQRSTLSPTGTSTLLAVATVGGLRATTSLERFEARSEGRESDPGNWIHAIQPSWSLETLFIPHRQIRQRWVFALHEAPLTAIPPRRTSSRTLLATGWKQPRRDLNVQGGSLISGGEEHGWGWGVHAHQELEFDLPPAARTFRTRFGLDRVVGGGGCVRALVYNGSLQTEPLFESQLLIGSDTLVDTGRMALVPAVAERSRLVLVADAVERQTPAGADPLDVRDVCNWIEPLVELNPQEAYQEITGRWASSVEPWRPWEVVEPYLETWRLVHVKYPLEFRAVVQADRTLTWRRRLRIEPQRDVLALRLTHPDRKLAVSQWVVTVDGQEVGTGPIDVVADLASAPAPRLVSLAAFHGREVLVELQVRCAAAGSTFDFRGADLTESNPGGK